MRRIRAGGGGAGVTGSSSSTSSGGGTGNERGQQQPAAATAARARPGEEAPTRPERRGPPRRPGRRPGGGGLQRAPARPGAACRKPPRARPPAGPDAAACHWASPRPPGARPGPRGGRGTGGWLLRPRPGGPVREPRERSGPPRHPRSPLDTHTDLPPTPTPLSKGPPGCKVDSQPGKQVNQGRRWPDATRGPSWGSAPRPGGPRFSAPITPTETRRHLPTPPTQGRADLAPQVASPHPLDGRKARWSQARASPEVFPASLPTPYVFPVPHPPSPLSYYFAKTLQSPPNGVPGGGEIRSSRTHQPQARRERIKLSTPRGSPLAPGSGLPALALWHPLGVLVIQLAPPNMGRNNGRSPAISGHLSADTGGRASSPMGAPTVQVATFSRWMRTYHSLSRAP